MLDSNDSKLPDVLRDATAGATPERVFPHWITRDDVRLLACWMARNPVDVCWIIERERDLEAPGTVDFAFDGAVDPESVATRKRYAEGFLGAALLTNCSRCFGTVILLPSGIKREFPSFDDHEAGCVDIADQLAIKPATRPTWRRRAAVAR